MRKGDPEGPTARAMREQDSRIQTFHDNLKSANETRKARVEEHAVEWMKLQEAANREITQLLMHIDERLKAIEARVEELDRRTFGQIKFK